MTCLLLIRHGETERNVGGLALGRDDVPLNERGIAQARAIAGALAGDGSYGVIDAVYSSPLRRAFDTAHPLAGALGLSVTTDDALIEMDVGTVEGLTFAQVRERHPEFLRRWFSDGLADLPMPGGAETLRGVQQRAWATVQSVRDAYPDGTVAAVTHNFVILTLLCATLDLPLARFRHLRHELAAVSAIELTEERQTVVALNDLSHLRAAGLASRPWRRGTRAG